MVIVGSGALVASFLRNLGDLRGGFNALALVRDCALLGAVALVLAISLCVR